MCNSECNRHACVIEPFHSPSATSISGRAQRFRSRVRDVVGGGRDVRGGGAGEDGTLPQRTQMGTERARAVDGEGIFGFSFLLRVNRVCVCACVCMCM